MRFARRRVSEEIPTLSMVNLAFLLFIYFLVTSTYSAARGLDFPLTSEEHATIEKEEPVLITIHAGGRLEVDGQAMRLEAILDYLEPRLAANGNKPVVLRAQPDAAYGDMVRVYDLLRRGKDEGVEVENIVIPTQREIDQFWY